MLSPLLSPCAQACSHHVLSPYAPTVYDLQAACALSNLADGDEHMQASIIDHQGIAPLLSLVRSGSAIAQEWAARAIWYLSTSSENQSAVVEAGALDALTWLEID